MSDRFNDVQMHKLVETYRDYECLWNVNNELYKNREARETAYKEIWEKLNISGISIRDIPKKIKNMRTSYYQELKKIERSAGHDPVYKPKVSWFPMADGFLRTFANKQEAFANYTVSDTQCADEGELMTTASVSYDVSVTQYTETDAKAPARKRTIQPSDNYVTKVKAVEEMVHHTAPNNSSEFDIFGKSVAAQLKAMPVITAIQAQSHIQNYLTTLRVQSIVNPLNIHSYSHYPPTTTTFISTPTSTVADVCMEINMSEATKQQSVYENNTIEPSETSDNDFEDNSEEKKGDLLL